jgi:hypothetical protein
MAKDKTDKPAAKTNTVTAGKDSPALKPKKTKTTVRAGKR